MKTNYDHLLPAPEVLYRLAKQAKDRSRALDDTWGSTSTRESFQSHLNEIAIKYLIANGGR